MFHTEPRVVAITGASSGIGRCTASLFARKGWRVGLIARGEAGLDAAREEVVAQGGTACVAPADVADPEALERAAARIEAELGPIDVWVNDAGVSVYAPFTEMTEEEFRRVTDVTYLGQVHGTRVALRRMMPRNRGTIVCVGSAVAFRGVPLQSAYCGAKYALRGFTEAVRTELIHAGSKVRLTMVHPPAVNTPFFSHAVAHMEGAVPRPPPPVYQPEVIADAIHFAVTSRRREVKVSASTLQYAWLNILAPGVADRMLGWFGVAAQRSRSAAAQARRDPSVFAPPQSAPPVHGPWAGLRHSRQLWATKHRGLVALGLGVAAVTLASRRRA